MILEELFSEYLFGGTEHITIKKEGKNFLFQAEQIGDILQVRNLHGVLSHYANSEVIQRDGTRFLTEKGLYKLILHSSSSVAIAFQEWVYSTLEEIRRHGEYSFKQEISHLKDEVEQLKEKNVSVRREYLDTL
jgi:prophage antirepressor-like protein